MDLGDLLFIGTHGHIAALDKATGDRRWCTSLPSTGFQIVSIVVEDGVLFAASRGHVFALDPVTGRIQWSNGLSGLGHGHVFLTTARSSPSNESFTSLARAATDDAGS